MDVSIRNQLMEEYVKNFIIIFRILEITGFCRFVIRKGKIVKRNTKLYNIFVLIYANASAAYLLWFSNREAHYLSTVEYIAILHFTVFVNLLLFDITFGDQYGSDLMLSTIIEIDTLLGAEETAFMRQISIFLYRGIVAAIGFTQVFVVAYMYYVFNVSITIHIVGSFYFLWLFFAYDEFCFFIYLYSFLTIRSRFLNVALMKITNIKMEYIPKQGLLHTLFWKDEYDDRVTFHTRPDTKEFCVVLKMCFDLLRRIENCYSFALLLGVLTVAAGSLVAVQTFIMYVETFDNTMILRATAMLGWSGSSWFHLVITSFQSDLFFNLIEQMKLICAYIQLKPNTSDKNFRLTKDILNILEVRDANVSVYGMFSFNTGLTLAIAASTFVYITVQLQLAFPNLKEVQKFENVTLTPPEFDFNPDKVKEFWFF